jgi:hypothetical protein
MPTELASGVDKNRTRGTELFQQAGEQVFKNGSAAHQQAMCVGALRHALAGLRRASNLIALDQGHLLELVGENPRSEETGNAAAGNNGMVTRTARHSVTSILCR